MFCNTAAQAVFLTLNHFWLTIETSATVLVGGIAQSINPRYYSAFGWFLAAEKTKTNHFKIKFRRGPVSLRQQSILLIYYKYTDNLNIACKCLSNEMIYI